MVKLDKMQAVSTEMRKKANKLERETARKERERNKLVKHVEQLQKMEEGFKERIVKATDKRNQLRTDLKDANRRKLEADRSITRLQRQLKQIAEQNKRLAKKRAQARIAAAQSERKARHLQNRARRSGIIKIGRE
jgi:chromosome segregation ATPase